MRDPPWSPALPGPLVLFTGAARSPRVSLAVRKKFCSPLISNIALTYTIKLLNSGAQFTCFYHRGQTKVKLEHLEFTWGSVLKLQHRAAGHRAACQGTDPKSLIGAAERRRRRRKMQQDFFEDKVLYFEVCAPTPVLHLWLPCLPIIFSWAGSRCLSQIFWLRRVKLQGNRNETCVCFISSAVNEDRHQRYSFKPRRHIVIRLTSGSQWAHMEPVLFTLNVPSPRLPLWAHYIKWTRSVKSSLQQTSLNKFGSFHKPFFIHTDFSLCWIRCLNLTWKTETEGLWGNDWVVNACSKCKLSIFKCSTPTWFYCVAGEWWRGTVNISIYSPTVRVIRHVAQKLDMDPSPFCGTAVIEFLHFWHLNETDHPVTWRSCCFKCDSIDFLPALPLSLTHVPFAGRYSHYCLFQICHQWWQFTLFSDNTSVFPLK